MIGLWHIYYKIANVERFKVVFISSPFMLHKFPIYFFLPKFCRFIKITRTIFFLFSWRPLTFVWYHTSSGYNALFITSYFLKISTYRHSQCIYILLSHVLANYTSRICRIFHAAALRWTTRKNLSSNDNRHNFSLLIHTSIHIW